MNARNHLAALLFACLGLAASTAQAASSASSSLTGFSVTLYSLSGSGTPSITWGSDSFDTSYGYASVYHGIVEYPLDRYTESFGASTFGALSVGATSPYAQAAASVSGGDGLNPTSGTSLHASGSSIGSATPGGGTSTYFDSRATTPDDYYVGYGAAFTLSAKSFAIFSVNATAATSASAGIAGDAFAEARAAIRVFGTGPSDPGSFISECACGSGLQDVQDALQRQSFNFGDAQNAAESLVVVFTNNTNADKIGYFSAEVSVYGYSSAAVVPEPEAYAMLLAGLGLLAAVARRRTRAA